MNWALFFTLFRILATALIVGVVLFRGPYWNEVSAVLFVLASLTDALDGYLARRLNKVTPEGQLLDPMADKILVSSTLILLVELGILEALVVILLISRDILVGGIRSMAAHRQWILPAYRLGKWKTALQMVALPLCLWDQQGGGYSTASLGYALIGTSLVFSLISGGQYFLAYRKHRIS